MFGGALAVAPLTPANACRVLYHGGRRLLTDLIKRRVFTSNDPNSLSWRKKPLSPGGACSSPRGRSRPRPPPPRRRPRRRPRAPTRPTRRPRRRRGARARRRRARARARQEGGAVPAVPAVVRTPRQVTLEQLVTMLLEVDIGLAYLTEQVSAPPRLSRRG